MLRSVIVFSLLTLLSAVSTAQENPLWDQAKVKNYLPHMTVPDVRDLLTRTDMVIIPFGALEQHGNHLPIGTDYLNGVERAKLIAQRMDALVVPITLPGQSPYHMEFPGTITLSSETLQAVYVEAAESLIRHGFKRFLILNAHGGNRSITTFIVDRINQETAGIAVDLGAAAGPFREDPYVRQSDEFDRHGGVGETSNSLYLIPSLVDMDSAEDARLSMPEHLEAMIPGVISGDPTITRVFLAENLKATETGKGTSSAEISTNGVWSVRDLSDSTAELGQRETEDFVQAAVRFMERWNELRPHHLAVQ